MAIDVSIPGGTDLQLDYLLLDVNGTLTDRGQLIPGVQARIERLRSSLDIRLLSADTFGTLDEISRQLGDVRVNRVSRGLDKADLARQLGPSVCAAIGNGRNDQQMLSIVALGIAVLGPEGTAPNTLNAAEVVTPTIGDALDLLLEPASLTATLRA